MHPYFPCKKDKPTQLILFIMPRFANYEYHEKIGQGSFGTIYKGTNIKTGEQVVVKMEPFEATNKLTAFSALKHESNILNILYSKNCRNIPPTYWYGTIAEPPPRRVLVMPFYEESLERVIGEKDPAIASNIMRSAISILEHIHAKYVIHRDIKPANFMIHNNELILIDFGLATFYVDSDEKHILPSTETTKKQHIIGTPKYASWNIHCGEEYSRRDDLMSIVYIGLFLLYGTGLWADNQSFIQTDRGDPGLLSHPRNQWFKTQKSRENIMNLCSHSPTKQISVIPSGLDAFATTDAEGIDQFVPLQIFADYIYRLSFQERPSYTTYIRLFT